MSVIYFRCNKGSKYSTCPGYVVFEIFFDLLPVSHKLTLLLLGAIGCAPDSTNAPRSSKELSGEVTRFSSQNVALEYLF